MGPSLLNDLSTFLIFIGLSNLFNLKPYFLANSELMTSPVVPLSSNASTVISFYISILFKPIFTIIFLSVFPSVFLTSIFLFSSDSNILAFILIASTLYLLQESSRGTLDSPPLLNCSNVCKFSQTPISFLLLLFSSSYNYGPYA